uniref:Arrestin C-terminal-like domain-containing protein n=2 Tax=Odontella aurita TaxID=265563 RepID=A0A7S4HXA3_9STRA|mmetsp:Transcript_16618/g.47854  ORF Transcript_16618/g.47854 Transcript_16618/m.47854 type:complete len:407 (+) Transcript_16618:720-1940(+)
MHVQSAPLPPILYPVMVEPVTKLIANAMRSSKGSITFGVRVSNAHIGRGEDLELRIGCRNDSTVNVERVQAKVKEKVEWMGAKESTKEDILAIPSIVPDAEGLGKKSKTELKEKKKAGVDDNYLDIFGEITSSSNDDKLIKLRIPATSRDTFKGQIISVKHILVIKIKTKWGVDDPKIEIPLKVGSRAVDEAHEPTVRLPPPVPLPSTSGEDISGDVQPLPAPVAVPIGWAASEKSLRIIAPKESIVVGGAAFDSSNNGEPVSSDPVVPVPSPKPPDQPTLDNLLAKMVSSVNDYELISAKLEDPDWKGLFSSLTPEHFGSILAQVNQDFDEPRVAALIAHAVGNGAFSCNHCVAALKACAEWNRIAVVQELLPFISDLSSGMAIIESELTPWEKIVTSKDFERIS